MESNWYQFLEKENQQLLSDRHPYEAGWMEMQQYIWPESGRFIKRGETKPWKRQDVDRSKILKDTAGKALDTAKAGLMAGTTSPAAVWFRLETQDQDLGRFGPHREWLDIARDTILDIYARSNFYKVTPNLYGENLLYGAALAYQVEDTNKVVRFVPTTIGEFTWGLGPDLEVDTVYREFYMTVRQMVERFGKDRCSKATANKYDKQQYYHHVPVIHVVRPNSKDIPKAARPLMRFPYASIYYEKGASKQDMPLSARGVWSWMCSDLTWDTTSNDAWGQGQGAKVIDDVKELQFWTQNRMEGVHKTASPPWLVPAGQQKRGINIYPDGVTEYDPAMGADAIKPGHVPNYPTADVSAIQMELKEDIRNGLYNDLFRQLLDSDRRDFTAREIDERREEKLMNLGPALQRMEQSNGRTIDRTFDILVRNELLPPAPPDLQGHRLKVEYLGFLSQAQRAIGTAAIDKLDIFIGGLAQAKGSLEPWDNVDTDEQVRDYAYMVGVNAAQVKSEERVAEIRQQRAQQEQLAQGMALAGEAAATAKTMSETDMEQRSALTEALDLMGAGV